MCDPSGPPYFRHTAENLQVSKIEYALSVLANKLFQKRAIFVFTESSSRDQLLHIQISNPIGLFDSANFKNK